MNQYESIKQTLIKNPKKWLVTGVAGFICFDRLQGPERVNENETHPSII